MIQTTTVKSIVIEKLFDIFTYHINYPTDENVLIITGPNGFGKTQVLNILFNLFNRNFLFFQKLVFHKITVCLSDEISIEINRTINFIVTTLLYRIETKLQPLYNQKIPST